MLPIASCVDKWPLEPVGVGALREADTLDRLTVFGYAGAQPAHPGSHLLHEEEKADQ